MCVDTALPPPDFLLPTLNQVTNVEIRAMCFSVLDVQQLFHNSRKCLQSFIL